MRRGRRAEAPAPARMRGSLQPKRPLSDEPPERGLTLITHRIGSAQRRLCTVVLCLSLMLAWSAVHRPAAAQSDDYAAAISALNADSFRAKQAAIEALVALRQPAAVPVLEAMLDNRLHVRDADGRIVIVGPAGGDRISLTDATTLAALGEVAEDEVSRIRVNNRVRRALRAAIGQLRIADPDPAARRAAAEQLAGDRSPETAELLRAALATETDPGIREVMTFSLAQIDLIAGDRDTRLAAIALLAESPSPAVRGLLAPLVRTGDDGTPAEEDEAVRQAAEQALERIENHLFWVEFALNVYQGVSLGSVLLLAAIGLAITFGVMGVINMAHGEMIMLGAYTTFVVQEAFRAFAPAWIELYVVAAVPAAFIVAGAVGVGLERGVVRFLYGRPLETLLATWGISLILQQAVRMIFGAPNREVANPEWMTGGFEALGGAVLTYNRVTIILFAFVVLAGVALIIRFTRFGLQMRAVTQNRRMASAMGIRSGWVDALTFGLGSGIAGVGGVALSQIGNVSPNLGQSYIVDSFMVVVFGGVGSLWGVLAASMSLGILNKFLEPYAGAMLGKILVLVFIILFIQRYPRGLFALKGRAAEA